MTPRHRTRVEMLGPVAFGEQRAALERMRREFPEPPPV
ncbi:MAG: hypothetical protein JWM18_2076 [Chloroflexi bacterium]|jgi:hypothetical protein|nr:hypothetical protein [Chloroflexota bacterium]